MITIPINNIRLEGIIAKAVSVPSNFLSSQEQEKEKVPSINKNNFSQDKFDISYKTTHPLEDSSFVAFKDPMNDKWVILSLKNDTINKLKEHFGEDDFYQKENGIIRLDNKAEAYVAGWYADVAYKENFLNADKNNDGIIDREEYKNTNTTAEISISLDGDSLNFKVKKSYEKDLEGNYYPKNTKFLNIDLELDRTINYDENFNSEISLYEHYKNKAKEEGVSLTQMLQKDIEEFQNSLHKPLNDTKFFKEEDMIKMLLKNSSKELKALEKLHTNPDSLTKEEKELIKNELEAIKNKDGSINKDKLNEIIKSLKAQNKYLENMAFAMES